MVARHKIERLIGQIMILFVFGFVLTGSSSFGEMVELKSDTDIAKHFVYLNKDGAAVKKKFFIDGDLSEIDKVSIKYFAPHPPAGIKNASQETKVDVFVNDEKVETLFVCKKAISRGWNLIGFSPTLLKKGDNYIEFKLELLPESQGLTVYFGLDTGNYQEKTFYRYSSTESWRAPSRVSKQGGEAMIRLLYSTKEKSSFIPFRNEKFNLDGKINADEWKHSLVLEEFYNIKNKGDKAEEFTEVFLNNDDDFLYLGIVCHAKNTSLLKFEKRERDGKIWADDSVELFISPGASKDRYYHFVVNPAGSVYDSYCATAGRRDPRWDSNLQSEAFIGNNVWTVEMKIPFDTVFGKAYKDFAGNRKVGLNIVRNNKTIGENSSWVLLAGRGIHSPKEFSEFTMNRKATPSRIAYKDISNSSTFSTDKLWNVQKSVFESVLSNQKRALADISGFSSHHGREIYVSRAKEFALQNGVEYLRQDFLSMPEELGIAVEDFGGICGFLKKGTREYKEARANNLKICYKDSVFAASYAKHSGKYITPRRPIVFETEKGGYFEKTLKQSCDVLRANKDIIDYVWHDDESIDSNIDFFYTNALSEKWEGKKKLNEEVKAKFGFGKFGLPEKHDSVAPFNWIATNRWFFSQINDIYRLVHDEQKSIKPELLIGSTTHRNGYKSFLNLSRLADNLDIVNAQICSDLNPKRQNIAFQTKILKDLSDELPVYPYAHIENYQASFTPDEVNEFISQIFRGGGEGFMIFFSDCTALVEDAGKNYSYCDLYGAPARWAMTKHLFKTIKNMNKLEFPKAETGIFISVDTESSMKCGYSSERFFSSFQEPLFTVLGPKLEYWFKYFSDNQVADGKQDLSKFKIVYVPYAKYERETAAEKIMQYVEKGGVAVLGTPESFRYSDDGTDRIDSLSSKLGFRLGDQLKLDDKDKMLIKTQDLQKGISGSQLDVGGLEGFKLIPADSARIIAVTKSGLPALIEHEYGKGKFITFAFNPFQNIENGEWQQLINNFQTLVSCKGKQEVWRFKFPDMDYSQPEEKLQCLTGNYFEWRLNKAVPMYNVSLPGAYYQYSLSPDNMQDISSSKPAFTEGKLTNRLQAPASYSCAVGPKDLRTKLSDWAVSWHEKAPFNIDFNFEKKVSVAKIRIFYHGDLPDFKVLTGNSGNYIEVATFKGKTSGDYDTPCYVATIPATMCDSLKVEFDERKGELTIGEIDIWGSSN